MAFGRLLDGESKTTIVEDLVIPARLEGVQATNFVLTQQASALASAISADYMSS